ncbi:unnamed protein product [Darwinula stevensoni]|uniref:J domain-containing protein n=1 Tax=Darwinula stevensoni TaxID=69355 RepID=A0A7R8X0W8_9CRUS|nr:unnamed protein product [Darwinula stevensoni]CAG0881633.1 unnamed protein product [Darwinula stevensoni]
MDSIFNYEPQEDDDLYKLLNCHPSSTTEQILKEYKLKAMTLHPDKNAGDNRSQLKFQKLQKAKEILTDPEKRMDYDKWKQCGMVIPYSEWLALKDKAHMSMHWATPKTEHRCLPDGEEGKESINTSTSTSTSNKETALKVTSFSSSDGTIYQKFRNYKI